MWLTRDFSSPTIRNAGAKAIALVLCTWHAGSAHAQNQPLRWQGSEPVTATAWDNRSLATYDATRGVVVALDMTKRLWTWDGVEWTTLRAAPGAEQVSSLSHELVCDEARGVWVIPGFGLSYPPAGILRSSTLEYDGASWAMRTTETATGPSTGYGAAYAPVRRVVAMVGGWYKWGPGNTQYYRLTGVSGWTGESWRFMGRPRAAEEPAMSGPSVRLAYDRGRQRLMSIGGSDDFERVRSTYAMVGDNLWRRIDREEFSGAPTRMHYDSRRSEMVMLTVNEHDVNDAILVWAGDRWRREPFTELAENTGSVCGAFDEQKGVFAAFGGSYEVTPGVRMRRSGVYELRDTRWTRVSPLYPKPRSGAAAVWDHDRSQIVMFGGQISAGQDVVVDTSTYTWDGAVWTEHMSVAPARIRPAMAFDRARGVVVMFGGAPTSDSPPAGDTWEWNGERWDERATTGPAPRHNAAMVYDESRGRIVLFGGGDRLRSFSDTWTWDGATWTRLASVGPSARERHAMAYDRDRATIVLAGGIDRSGPLYEDTWELRGDVWTRMSQSGLGLRYGHSMIYDTRRHVTVAWGGERAANTGEMWEWNGSVWTRATDVDPHGRHAQAAAYDEARGQIVAFGGVVTTGPGAGLAPDDTWRFGVDCPTPVIVRQPAAWSGRIGESAELSVEVQAADGLSFQWRHGFPPRNVEGATAATLRIDQMRSADVGRYDCVIISRNVGCFSRRIISAAVIVQACPADLDGSGEIDDADWLIYVGRFERGEAAADFNGDGFLDYFDFDEFAHAWESGC